MKLKKGKIEFANILIDLTGKRFGRWTVIKRGEDGVRPNGDKYTRWECLCDCGNSKLINSAELRYGRTRSCGCLRCELISKRRRKYNIYDLSGNYGIGYTSKGEEFYFDLEDYDLIKDYCWRVRKDDKYLDAKILEDGENKYKRILLHRLIMNNPKEIIDHINNIGYDCRKNNLRLVTDSQNMMNKGLQKNNNTGCAGVTWHKRDLCYEVHISINHKNIYLGRFNNFEDAVKTRKRAEEKYFGEYSYDNSQLISDNIINFN